MKIIIWNKTKLLDYNKYMTNFAINKKKYGTTN